MVGECIGLPSPYNKTDMPTTRSESEPFNAPPMDGLEGSKLLRLPADTLVLIFDEVQCLADAMFLCISHNILGACGERRVYALLLRELAPWRGQRLACIGENTQDNDYPPQLQRQVEEWKRLPEAQPIPIS